MDLESFLTRHGLLALFAITTVEGDIALVVAGVVAHLGFFPPLGAILAGAGGNLVGDCLWYFVGRHQGGLIRRTRLYRRVGPKVESLADRIGPAQLLAARLVYGTRNVSMLFWGMRHLAVWRFLLLDALGCLIVATGFVWVGFALGQGTASLTDEVRRLEHWLLGAVVAAVLVVWLVSRFTQRQLRGGSTQG